MAAIKRALLPPILNTVKSLTLSALGKVCRSSVNELKSVCLTIRYHDSSAVEQSGCLLVNSSKRFRVITCTGRAYLKMRYLSIEKYNGDIVSSVTGHVTSLCIQQYEPREEPYTSSVRKLLGISQPAVSREVVRGRNWLRI